MNKNIIKNSKAQLSNQTIGMIALIVLILIGLVVAAFKFINFKNSLGM